MITKISNLPHFRRNRTGLTGHLHEQAACLRRAGRSRHWRGVIVVPASSRDCCSARNSPASPLSWAAWPVLACCRSGLHAGRAKSRHQHQWDGDLRPARDALPLVPRHSRRVGGPTLVAGRGVARRADIAAGTLVVECKKCWNEITNRSKYASRKDHTVRALRTYNGIAASARECVGDPGPVRPSGLRCDDTRVSATRRRVSGAASV